MQVSTVALLVTGVLTYLLFLWWRLRLVRTCCSTTLGPRWLARVLTTMNATVAWLAGVEIGSSAGPGLEADPSRPYVYVWHPHGFVAYAATMLVGGMAVRGRPHRRAWFASCALPLILPTSSYILYILHPSPYLRSTVTLPTADFPL